MYYIASTYGSGTFDSSSYNGSTTGSGTTSGSSGSSGTAGTLTNTGFDVLVAVTLACVIIFAALLVRFWRRKPLKSAE